MYIIQLKKCTLVNVQYMHKYMQSILLTRAPWAWVVNHCSMYKHEKVIVN